MANAIAWDERPDYLMYTDWTPIPGITDYAFPRNGSGTNVTQFHPGQAFLSEYNLPDIMYQLYPCKEWKRFKESPLPDPKRNPDGTLVYEQYTRPGHERQPLLDFKILPDKISSEEGWWYHEFVRRMDPRIRYRDIMMREEASGERSRMSDQQYINIHLNTPGYRIYRPKWKMIAWHVKEGDDAQNDRKQSVLDDLTDAQKQANTTRGSTPGLINPALGEAPGNRVDLPALVIKKRGPKRATANANNVQATQQVQQTQALQVPHNTEPLRAVHVAQAYRAPKPPQARHDDQDSQTYQPSQAKGSDVPMTSSSVVSTTNGAPSQSFAGTAAASGENDIRGYTNIQARDAVAMPPPPRPLKSRTSRLPEPQLSVSNTEPPYPTNLPAEFDGTRAGGEEVDGIGATTDHVLEQEYAFMSDEEMTTMSARSDEAIAEIYRMCEPFLDPCSDLQGPPPMDLSAELIDDFGIGFMFPSPASGQMREKGSKEAIRSPAQARPPRNVAEQRAVVPKKQGTKRKDYESEEDNESYQDERQERRPVKRVRSARSAKTQHTNGGLYQGAVHNFQQQPPFAPQSGNYQTPYTHGQSFGWPAPQGARPAQYASVENANLYTGNGSCEEQHQSSISPDGSNTQHVGYQSATARPGSRDGHGHHGKPWEDQSHNHRFHPY